MSNKKSLKELNLQINEEKTFNSQCSDQLSVLYSDKNQIMEEIKELEVAKTQSIVKKAAILQEKNELAYELKELDIEVNRKMTGFEIQKKELETKMNSYKNEVLHINSSKERESKAYEFESKKLEHDIKNIKERIAGFKENIQKYTNFINEVKAQELISIQNIKREATEFNEFVENEENL